MVQQVSQMLKPKQQKKFWIIENFINKGNC